MKISEIFIANTAEAFIPLLESGANNVQRIQNEIALSQRSQFLGKDSKAVVTYTPISDILLRGNIRRLKYTEIVNLAPAKTSLRLCKEILNDHELFAKILHIVKNNPGIMVSSYAVTGDYVALIAELRKEAPEFICTNIPTSDNSVSLVAILDSKDGFREKTKDLFVEGRVRFPEWFLCKNRGEVAQAIAVLISKGKGFVVKIHNGESGWGTKAINSLDAHELDILHINEWVDKLLSSEGVWNFAPYIVEEFILTNKRIGGGFPSGEAHIHDAGLYFDYSCGQELDDAGSFYGISMGMDAIPKEYKILIEHACTIIGERYFALGYRGTFDIDFAAGEDGNLYILESNARVTGGTHVYNLLSHLGLGLSDHFYAISNDTFQYGDFLLPPNKILANLSSLLYPMKNNKQGLIISHINSASPIIGLISIANSESGARSLLYDAQNRFTA